MDKPRRMIAKIEWHPGEPFSKVGFIVANLPNWPEWVIRFYDQRGTAKQHIKKGKYAFRWTRLSCRRFRHDEVRLQLHALAYSLPTFLRCTELPEILAGWSLTSLQLKLIEIVNRAIRHARAITFQLSEVAITGPIVRLSSPRSNASERRRHAPDYDPKTNVSSSKGMPTAMKTGPPRQHGKEPRLDPTSPACFPNRRHPSGRKTVDMLALSDDRDIRGQATWGISGHHGPLTSKATLKHAPSILDHDRGGEF